MKRGMEREKSMNAYAGVDGDTDAVDIDLLKRKLHPDRFVGMSNRMVALIGYFLGEWYTDPRITGLCVTADGMVLAKHDGGLGYDWFIGSYDDLERNWLGLINLEPVGLTDAERAYCKRLLDTMVRVGGSR